MFFGKKQTGMMNQMPAVNMVNDGYGPGQFTPEGMYPDQTPMGYGAEPYGYYGPGMEHVGMEHMEHVGMEAERPCPEEYVVKKGDSVYKIAQKYGLDWRILAGYNHLGNPDLIYPGERLFIPPSCCS